MKWYKLWHRDGWGTWGFRYKWMRDFYCSDWFRVSLFIALVILGIATPFTMWALDMCPRCV